MINSKILDAIEATVKTVLAPYDLDEETVSNAVAVIRGTMIAVKKEAASEPPMKVGEAARLLGCTIGNVNFHCRRGRIRRVKIPGSSRACGLVAADVRAILEGRAN